jgi:hypothetical protein
MCEVTEGRELACDQPGGTLRAFLYSIRDSAGLTNYATGPTVVSGNVTALTLKAGKYAYPFNVEAETIEAEANSIGETVKGSSAYEHKTVIKLIGNTVADIAQAEQLVKGRVGVILELRDGTFELYHYETGGKVQRNRNPGTALDDMNGSTLTITSRQVGSEVKISSVIVDALREP